jgi:RHS repeat-associated protein
VDGTTNTGDNGKNQLMGDPLVTPLQYDAAGNVTYDGTNVYVYDGDGRLCAMQPISGSAAFGYLYDADGDRVAKGTINASAHPLTSPPSCDPTSNGFQLAEDYVLDTSGQELTMLNGSSNWQLTNVFGGGRLLATYDPNGLHFHVTDPLGTRRLQTSAVGQPETDIQSLPFGDQLNPYTALNAPTTADDATPLHFTGKERDQESGNDYFGARYYASTMGRFLSPDWSVKEEPVPYAKLGDPQTLNLYGYLRNNPLGGVDADGHCGAGPNDPPCSDVKVTVDQPKPEMKTNEQSANGPVSGPGVHTTVSITQQNGKPVSGTTVNENPKTTDNISGDPVKTPAGTATTNSQGTFKDNVIAPMTNSPVTTPEQKAQLTSDSLNMPYSHTTLQTLTFTAGGAACQATFSETLQNVNPDTGKFNDTNSNGVNFTFTATTPVVSPQPPN